MWPTWGGIRESSLKRKQICDPYDFHLMEQKTVRQGAARTVMRKTGDGERGEEEQKQ